VSDLAEFLKDPVVQYGALGFFFAYAIYTDWITRRENRKQEADRIKRDQEREKRAEDREAKCAAEMSKLRDEHKQEFMSYLNKINQSFSAFVQIANKNGVKLRTPSEIETDAIERKHP